MIYLYISWHAKTGRYWHGMENSYTNILISTPRNFMDHVFPAYNNILLVPTGEVKLDFLSAAE